MYMIITFIKFMDLYKIYEFMGPASKFECYLGNKWEFVKDSPEYTMFVLKHFNIIQVMYSNEFILNFYRKI